MKAVVAHSLGYIHPLISVEESITPHGGKKWFICIFRKSAPSSPCLLAASYQQNRLSCLFVVVMILMTTIHHGGRSNRLPHWTWGAGHNNDSLSSKSMRLCVIIDYLDDDGSIQTIKELRKKVGLVLLGSRHDGYVLFCVFCWNKYLPVCFVVVLCLFVQPKDCETKLMMSWWWWWWWCSVGPPTEVVCDYFDHAKKRKQFSQDASPGLFKISRWELIGNDLNYRINTHFHVWILLITAKGRFFPQCCMHITPAINVWTWCVCRWRVENVFWSYFSMFWDGLFYSTHLFCYRSYENKFLIGKFVWAYLFNPHWVYRYRLSNPPTIFLKSKKSNPAILRRRQLFNFCSEPR